MSVESINESHRMEKQWGIIPLIECPPQTVAVCAHVEFYIQSYLLNLIIEIGHRWGEAIREQGQKMRHEDRQTSLKHQERIATLRFLELHAQETLRPLLFGADFSLAGSMAHRYLMNPV